MNRKIKFIVVTLCLGLSILLSGCTERVKADPKAEAPPPAIVEHEPDSSLVKVDHPDSFPLVTAAKHSAAPELNVTGTVSADVSRSIPVISVASGRILEIHARLGDTVTKGQLMMRVQNPGYRTGLFRLPVQAIADETLTKAQLDRSKILYEKGAVAQKDLEVAQDAEAKSVVAVETAFERVKGADRSKSLADNRHPGAGFRRDHRPAGDQRGWYAGACISQPVYDLRTWPRVWIICDVYENDMAFARIGEYADLIDFERLPHDDPGSGRISNISPVLDPNLRDGEGAGWEVANPGLLRLGMFVTATFHGLERYARAVPSTAILHLHDREWVYTPAEAGQFRRRRSRRVGRCFPGQSTPGNYSGIKPGDQVLLNALVLQNTVEQ